MHNKAVFALAGVFLAVALVVPTVILLIQADNDLDNLILIQNPSGMETGGNTTGVIPPDEIAESHQNNLIIIIAVEAVFLPLFVATLYYGINHVHPGHKPPEKSQNTINP